MAAMDKKRELLIRAIGMLEGVACITDERLAGMLEAVADMIREAIGMPEKGA